MVACNGIGQIGHNGGKCGDLLCQFSIDGALPAMFALGMRDCLVLGGMVGTCFSLDLIG